jgi:class 3 adenylate cyclase
MVQVVETIVARTGLETFALASLLGGVPIVLNCAARWPERVTGLVLADGWAERSELDGSPARQAEKALRGKDWGIYTETFARVLMGYQDSEYARSLAEYMRTCVEPDAYRSAQEAIDQYDASSVLSTITAPTLVVHNQHSPWVGVQSARRLASSIANSRFSQTDDLTYGELPALIHEFLSGEEISIRPAGAPSGTAIILFADIADSTALTERLGDAAFREKARALDEALRRAISSNGGTAIKGKLLGDGVLATFSAAREAIAAGLACEHAAAASELGLHIGLHAGDVIRERDNVYGGAVNIASRISELAAPGEVLVSRTVADLARTSAGVSFEDRGERQLKGVGEPVRVYAVHSTQDRS